MSVHYEKGRSEERPCWVYFLVVVVAVVVVCSSVATEEDPPDYKRVLSPWLVWTMVASTTCYS